jgi:hypothetical protein
MSEKKSIKYFGAHYCPHSNKNSRTYNLINSLFKNKYPEVDVEIYWSEDINEENKHEFINGKAKYVPTVTNSKYAHINLSLHSDYKTGGKTDDELSDAVLDNIYNQLDKEPEPEPEVESFKQNNSKEMEKPKDFIKETFGYINNNKFVGFIFILIIIILIIFPFYQNYCNKNVVSSNKSLSNNLSDTSSDTSSITSSNY